MEKREKVEILYEFSQPLQSCKKVFIIFLRNSLTTSLLSSLMIDHESQKHKWSPVNRDMEEVDLDERIQTSYVTVDIATLYWEI